MSSIRSRETTDGPNAERHHDHSVPEPLPPEYTETLPPAPDHDRIEPVDIQQEMQRSYIA
ncbi:hypothetical protein [Amycolatopsis japonica]|uniref:hypothetical protein n=1 Tax=Amycolatopsis japonica TaxID=208439 RepID=UPI00340D4EBE